MTVPADWQAFAGVMGGASAALTGLLFVAVSLNAANIAAHPGLRASAAQTLVLFLVPLFMAAVLLAPGQADWVVGGELIAVGVIASWALLSGGLYLLLPASLLALVSGMLNAWYFLLPPPDRRQQE